MLTSTISGIPCQINPTSVIRVAPDYSNDASDWDHNGYTGVEFEVYDRKGYPAPWLERKLTERDISRIENQILEEL